MVARDESLTRVPLNRARELAHHADHSVRRHAYGMLLFVLACGLSVTLGLMNFINLAHGAFAMAGGYCTVVLVNRSACRLRSACRSPSWSTAASARSLNARSMSTFIAEPSRPGAVHHRARLHVGGGRRLLRRLPAAIRASSRRRCRGSSIVFGIGMGKYRLLIIVICGLLTVAPAVVLTQDPIRQPPARRGRRCSASRAGSASTSARFSR